MSSTLTPETKGSPPHQKRELDYHLVEIDIRQSEITNELKMLRLASPALMQDIRTEIWAYCHSKINELWEKADDKPPCPDRWVWDLDRNRCVPPRP